MQGQPPARRRASSVSTSRVHAATASSRGTPSRWIDRARAASRAAGRASDAANESACGTERPARIAAVIDATASTSCSSSSAAARARRRWRRCRHRTRPTAAPDRRRQARCDEADRCADRGPDRPARRRGHSAPSGRWRKVPEAEVAATDRPRPALGEPGSEPQERDGQRAHRSSSGANIQSATSSPRSARVVVIDGTVPVASKCPSAPSRGRYRKTGVTIGSARRCPRRRRSPRPLAGLRGVGRVHHHVDRGGHLVAYVGGREIDVGHHRHRLEAPQQVPAGVRVRRGERPSWPVFMACSMSSASPPRTSPTMMRSGRMRSTLRTRSRTVTCPCPLRWPGEPRARPRAASPAGVRRHPRS